MQNEETLIQLVREDGFLVLSGILTSEMELVEDCFLNLLRKKETKIENDKKNSGEWSLLQLKLNA
jgi:ribosomal protein L11 methylase PrmA